MVPQLYNRYITKTLYPTKTKHTFWNTLEINDIIHVSFLLQSPGRSSNGLYAPEIKMVNERTREIFKTTLTHASNYLKKIDLIEVS